MFLYGVIAFLQITLLPGLVVLRLLRLRNNALVTVQYGFALSLVCNYFIVSALVIAHAYTRGAMLTVICLELVAIVFFLSRTESSLEKESRRNTANRPPQAHWLAAISLLVIGGFFVHYFSGAVAHPAFEGWDAIFSWNKWAVEWAQGHFPIYTYHYPQLLPANWSINYLLTGDEAVQLFLRLMMPLFATGSLLLLLDLALRTGKDSFHFAVIVLAWIFWSYYNLIVGEGYADVPASFLGLTAFHVLLAMQDQLPSEWKKRVYLGAFIGAGAGLMKQSGLMVPFMYGTLACFLLARKSQTRAFTMNAKQFGLLILLAVVVCVPSYLYQQVQISQDKAISEIAYVTKTIHASRGPLGRIVYGLSKIREAGPSWVELVLLILIAGAACVGVVQRTSRLLFFIVVLPTFIVWGLFFSYNYQNISLLLPALAICAGFGITSASESIRRVLAHLCRWLFRHHPLSWMIPGVLAIALGCLFVPSQSFINWQRAQRTNVGPLELNSFLLDFALHNRIEGQVVSNYQILISQPYWTTHARFNPLISAESVRMEMSYPDRLYLLQFGAISPEVSTYIEGEIKKGTFEIAAQSQILLLLRKRHR